MNDEGKVTKEISPHMEQVKQLLRERFLPNDYEYIFYTKYQQCKQKHMRQCATHACAVCIKNHE